MESRIRILLLSIRCARLQRLRVDALALASSRAARPPKADSSRAVEPDADAPPPSVIEPQVERRKVKVPEDPVQATSSWAPTTARSRSRTSARNRSPGCDLDYHISEDFFAEATYGRAKAGKTSFETLSGGCKLLSDAERRFTYYNLSLGYNLLPGEVFIGRNLAMTSALYLIGGIGSVKFAGEQNFTVNFGAGFRVLPTDWLAMHIDVQDLVFKSDVTRHVRR